MKALIRQVLPLIGGLRPAGSRAGRSDLLGRFIDPARGLPNLTCVVGTHLAEGVNGSVAGVGGSGINVPAGSALDGGRTYIYDRGYPGFAAGASISRADAGFATLVWDMGAAMNTMRLYTHQDHYGGGPIITDFIAQDVMEYSVWASNDNCTFSCCPT